MKNIISSVVYGLLHSKFLIKIYLLFIAVMIFTTIVNFDEKITYTSELMMGGASLTYVFNFFILAMAAGIICCEDYKDKTANFEIMSGYSRLKIYLARGIFAVIAADLMALLLSFVPVIAGNITHDWGQTIDFGDFMLRICLYFFPYMRVAAFLVLISVLIRNQYVLMGIGYFIMDYVIIRQEADLTLFKGMITGCDNIICLTKYDENLGRLPLKTAALTIGISLVMTGVYMFIGYRLFKRKDI